MLSGDTPSLRTRAVRLRTKFIAAFIVQTLFITLMTVGIEQWRVLSGRGSLVSDYFVVGVICIVVAFAFAVLAARLLIQPVLELSETAKLLAQGDLTQRTKSSTGDESSALGDAFKAMAGNLEMTPTEQMVSQINAVDRNIDYLANFVSETSSSMVEMSASIAQVESNAARSYDLSLAAAEAAESGMKAVRETITAMEQIRQAVVEANAVVSRLGERSTAIGRILNVIEDVAEQTNLLALNAAILAAQAGEHGKGFSVVASQIREPSERTASSTREITALIKAVQEEVRNALSSMSAGTKLVEDGAALPD